MQWLGENGICHLRIFHKRIDDWDIMMTDQRFTNDNRRSDNHTMDKWTVMCTSQDSPSTQILVAVYLANINKNFPDSLIYIEDPMVRESRPIHER